MKKILVTTMFFVVLFLIFSAAGFCGDSMDIQVSCTIPLIPGVNSPALLSETKTLESAKPVSAVENTQQEVKPKLLGMIQEDIRKDKTSAVKNDSKIMVTTLYPR